MLTSRIGQRVNATMVNSARHGRRYGWRPGGPGGPGGGGPGGGGGRGGSAVAVAVVLVAGGGNGRYNLTFSLNFNNILNHTNLGQSGREPRIALFGQSTSTAGGFGGFGGGNAAYNRRIDAQIRFSF